MCIRDRDISRLGAWLGDVVHTERCVRARTRRARVQFVVVLNSSYKVLGTKLGLDSGVNSSANNVGNIFEHLMWLALEEKRCEWILGVLRCLAVDGTATDGASSAGAAPREGEGSGAPPVVAPVASSEGLPRQEEPWPRRSEPGSRARAVRCQPWNRRSRRSGSSSPLPGASQPAETETKKRRVDSGESSDSEVSAPRSRTSDAFEADHADDEQAYIDVKQRADEVHNEMREYWNQRYEGEYDPKLLDQLSRLLFMKRKRAEPAEEDSAGAPHDPAFASQAETARAIAVSYTHLTLPTLLLV